MVKSTATTVDEYLQELPQDRQEAISTVRKAIQDNLPDGYKETMQYGMIGYVIPLERYPVTYNKQPLSYVALASQKNYMSVYLMNVYGKADVEDWFNKAYEASGKKLNMGKSCVRFKKLDDLPLDVIGKAVSLTSVDDYIAIYEDSRKNLK